ncbi:MAG: phosphate regulon sensor histidine kinase PhoR [Betaproteobacteria bacterium]|nr:phosphate regulon sensor histidine kinase PhoR [Betaproteobacteria bacterium]
MNDPLITTLLPVTVLALSALAVGFLSSAGELLAAGLLCLLACMASYRGHPYQRSRPSPGPPALEMDVQRIPAVDPSPRPQRGVAAQRRDPIRSLPRPLPEGLSSYYGIAILDRDHCIVWCNDAAAAHFGIDARQDIGRPISVLIRHPSFVAYMAAGSFSKSLRMQAKEGEGPILSVQFVPYVASGWLLLTRIVTRSARIESARRECIANVSHELRTPLTVLVGFLETVRGLKLDHQVSRDYLDLMEEQCKRMQRIIADLLQLSTLESAPEPSGDERVNVGKLLIRIQSEAEALSGARHRIVLEAGDGFNLLGAENEIASVFGNLASNAVRYTAPGGIVRLTWRASLAGAEFTVEDTGIGIEKRHIPRLTERFYRVDRGHSRHSGGTGLGLAIVKHALLRHQAALEIESEPGKGSRFTARFPAHRVIAAKIPIQAWPSIVQQPTKEVAYEDQDRHSSHQNTWPAA